MIIILFESEDYKKGKINDRFDFENDIIKLIKMR